MIRYGYVTFKSGYLEKKKDLLNGYECKNKGTSMLL